MAGRVVLAAILAAVVMFLWGFVYWVLVGVPDRMGVMAPFPGDKDASAGAQIRELVGESGETGVYVYPWSPELDADEAALTEHAERHRAGPRAQLFYNKDGAEPMGPAVLALGWLHYFVLALLAGIVLKMASPALPTFGQRVCVGTIVGLLGAIWTTIGSAIWFQHPWGFAVADAIYGIVAGLLMAVILAAIIKPRAGTA